MGSFFSGLTKRRKEEKNNEQLFLKTWFALLANLSIRLERDKKKEDESSESFAAVRILLSCRSNPSVPFFLQLLFWFKKLRRDQHVWHISRHLSCKKRCSRITAHFLLTSMGLEFPKKSSFGRDRVRSRKRQRKARLLQMEQTTGQRDGPSGPEKNRHANIPILWFRS